ncbi:nitroreductase family protein [Aestuariispira insulae]|uniref:Nitroreductase n=1 Tax=Aestuariispira insulae TaxID=1461337 RepID=A0A3D9HQ16_9PROT|nr:nitroreductase family protein [Aestuariispira insulae]RED51603.1 nitroreductase [Aestuariispira insulae]
MTMQRKPSYPIDPLFIERWSPRAFDAKPMPDEDLFTMLEAARWAPSAFNIQPWRFLYAIRGDQNWDRMLCQLDEFNTSWACDASALVMVISDSIMPGDETMNRPDMPSRYHSLDSGTAWAHFALQATRMDYHVHAIAGIDFEQAHREFKIPERFRIEIAIAIGRRTDPSKLPDMLQEREIPSNRKPLNEIAFAGSFPDGAY